MSQRSDIAPSTLGVELDPDGVFVTYLDGREVFYHGVPEKVTGPVRCQPGKQVHVLVTDPAGTQGTLVYINDRKTNDEILETTGVGRVLLDPDRSAVVFPGVEASMDGYAVEITADPEVVDGRVFVFEEDELGERAFEIVAPEDG